MSKKAITSPEHRQHISLSRYAYDVIVNDALTFMGKKNFSGFINTVVLNSGTHHFEDVLLNEKSRIEKELAEAKTKKANIDDRTIDEIARAHLKHHIKTYSSFPKEETLKIRLQNDLYEDLYPIDGDWEGAKYKINQGTFIKEVIEDYARKTLFERESIFYKDIIEAIYSHINSDESRKGIIPIITNDGEKLYVKPYRISEEYEAPYHYLIGMTSRSAEKGYIPSSTRISRIRSVKPRLSSYVSGKITQKEIKELELKIKANQVAYIVGDTTTFTIKLTPNGLKMYNTIFHQRPMYDSCELNSDDTTTLTITSTERQITNYFFNFGKEASIISPAETRKKLITRYKNALDSYNNNS